MQSANTNHLEAILQNLCLLIIKRVALCKEDGRITKIPFQFIPTRNIDFASNCYTHDYSKIEYYDYYDWTPGQFSEFRQQIEQLPEYNNAKEEILTIYSLPQEAQDIGLSMFVREFIKSIPNDISPDISVDKWIKFFVRSFSWSVNKEKSKWIVEAWLDDIVITCDEIEILPGVTLQRPQTWHFDIREQKKYHIPLEDRVFSKTMASSTILIFTHETDEDLNFKPYPDSIKSKIDCYLNILRLFRPCSVNVLFKTITPYSIFDHVWSTKRRGLSRGYVSDKVPFEDIAHYPLLLKPEDITSLNSFAKKMYPILTEHSVDDYFIGTSYGLALHRYNDALMNSEMKPFQIISAMSCLEALLSESPSEITFKIKMRVAALLGRIGFDSLDVQSKVNKAYGLRSKVVHGDDSKETKKLIEFARNHCYEIINYTRSCLIILLQLKTNKTKGELIQLINNSFVHNHSASELDKLLQENTEVPN